MIYFRSSFAGPSSVSRQLGQARCKPRHRGKKEGEGAQEGAILTLREEVLDSNNTTAKKMGSLGLFLQRFIHMETHCPADDKL